MLNKNDVVTVEITDIGVGGEGIGRVDGYTLFIKDAIIGDVVEAKVMKAKKKLWLCPDDGDYPSVGRSCRTEVCICKKVRWLSDPGNVL